MFKTTPPSLRYTLRVLARLLAYPDAQLFGELTPMVDALRMEQALPRARIDEIEQLCSHLATLGEWEAQARYVDLFDRGHKTSLHLFEHVHGDSRERGPALVDLQQTYEKAGLMFDANELPDHLPVVLEFASTQPPEIAEEFLGEMVEILNAIFSALVHKDSPYASVIAAVLEVAGAKAHAVAIDPEPDMDETWMEPEAFIGCSTKGQSRPGAEQPVHFVRKSDLSNQHTGVSA
ncbi:nitrate reductase molybdenum cofactor assembly chaperone [Diaphorobacter sp. HDW4A]|uniref:nitrate reductase molybdenum cofactor assembly chaperone n=1 Tax=Diaphorobacter sp. HDW4A TaxID=2714924 RepID=UPI0014088B06|nr:nitrate reductase molybdenum cofactor assembly chaperone [Diaphorobacter sp. HDW4A]QIL81999.1 nitrate reductase molybdenum cofactor assembly chaperone [Diaphorobacter sp. HDW4A]